MNQILALDYGLKKTGIAYAENPLFIAHALKTVKTHDLLIFIENHLVKNNVTKIVIGVPKSLIGGKTHSSDMIQNFSRRITKSFPKIEIKFYDERFTSKMASNALHMAGATKKQKKQKGLIDKVSATIILQSYLDAK